MYLSLNDGHRAGELLGGVSASEVSRSSSHVRSSFTYRPNSHHRAHRRVVIEDAGAGIDDPVSMSIMHVSYSCVIMTVSKLYRVLQCTEYVCTFL